MAQIFPENETNAIALNLYYFILYLSYAVESDLLARISKGA